MKCAYRDITSRLGSPLWWDEHGVPRYCEFAPGEQSDIYASVVAMLLVRCQACGNLMHVVVSRSWARAIMSGKTADDPMDLIMPKSREDFDYGDPPCDNCAAGPTMSSELVAVLECWVRRHLEWEREASLEGVIA